MKIQIGSKLKFHSGNFNKLTGIVTAVDFKSKSPRAIYGYYHTVILSNSKIGHVEKSEHFTILENNHLHNHDYSNLIDFLEEECIEFTDIENKCSELHSTMYCSVTIKNTDTSFHFDEDGGSQIFWELMLNGTSKTS